MNIKMENLEKYHYNNQINYKKLVIMKLDKGGTNIGRINKQK